jgi:hypothetical protein
VFPYDSQQFFSTPGAGFILFMSPLVISIILAIVALVSLKKFKNIQFQSDISRTGKALLNFNQYPFEHGSVIVDEEKFFVKENLIYPSLKDSGKVKELWNKYQETSKKLPIVLPHDKKLPVTAPLNLPLEKTSIYNAETEFHDIYNDLTSEYKNTDDIALEIGILKSEAVLTRHLESSDYALHKKNQEPSVKTMLQLEQIMGLVTTKGNEEAWDVDDFSHQVINTLEHDTSKLSMLRRHSLKNIIGTLSPRLSDIAHYGAYNFYCPHCHEQEITILLNQDFNAFKNNNTEPVTWNENARVYLTNWKTEVWKCGLCEKETKQPVPVHKMYSQVFLPAYNYLLLENEKERIRIYSKLNEKKIEYQQQAEKEQEEIERSNRSEMDVEIFKMRGLRAQVESVGETIQAMETLMQRINVLSQQRMATIKSFAREVQNQIVQQNKAIVEEVRADVSRMRKKTESAMNRLAYQARIEQRERDQVQQEMAQNLHSIKMSSAQTAINTGISAAIDLTRERKTYVVILP